MKRSILVGMRTRACMFAAVAICASSSASVRPRLGMKGKGWAGSTASGVSTGKDMQDEMLVEPELFGLAEVAGLDEMAISSASKFLLQLPPAAQLLLGQFADALADQRKLLARRQAVLRRRIDPGAQLPEQAGDTHHEEFIEIIGRNRDETNSLQQGVRQVRGFEQHPAVELQPGQLAVDEALGRRAEGLAIGDIDLAPPGRRCRGPRFRSLASRHPPPFLLVLHLIL